jgi:uncharacterized protein (DUF1330 family)
MSERTILVASLWIRAEAVAEFEAFERRVAAIQAKHGARIERAIRVSGPAANAAEPFEIHIVSFPSVDALASYRADSELTALAQLRATIFTHTTSVAGADVARY